MGEAPAGQRHNTSPSVLMMRSGPLFAAPCLYLVHSPPGKVWERETTRLTPCYQLTATMRLSYRGGTRDKGSGGAQKGVGSHPSICTAPFASCTGARTGGGGGQGKKRLRRHEGFGGGGLPSVCHYLRPRNLQPRGKASLRALGRCGYTPESGRGVSLSFGRHLRYMRPGCQEGFGLVPGTCAGGQMDLQRGGGRGRA